MLPSLECGPRNMLLAPPVTNSKLASYLPEAGGDATEGEEEDHGSAGPAAGARKLPRACMSRAKHGGKGL